MKTSSKLMAAVAMLVISAIMMTTASFAWFTISTAPEVTDMTSGVTANQNLEIALPTYTADGNLPALPNGPAGTLDNENKPITDVGNYYTWGNLIDLSANDLNGSVTEGNNTITGVISQIELRPMALTEKSEEDPTLEFTAPNYGADGRIKTVNGEKISAEKEEDAVPYGYGKLVDAAGTNTYGYYVDFWVRTNMTGAKLGLVETGTNRGPSGTEGAGSTVTATGGTNTFAANNVTIAVQQLATADTDNPNATEAAKVTPSTNTTIVAARNNGSGKLTSTNLLAMEANTAYLIRVYVFMNGATITNADAAAEATATVNLQFGLYNEQNTLVTMDAMTVPVAS